MNVLVAINDNADRELDELRADREKLLDQLAANLDKSARLEMAKLVSQVKRPTAPAPAPTAPDPEGGKS